MEREDFIKRTYQFATGEASAPPVGSEDYNRIVDLGNSFIEDWQNEPGIQWGSLYKRVDIGTVSATDRFSFDSTELRELSFEEDGVCLIGPNGQRAFFTLVQPRKLYQQDNGVARIGDEIVFGKPFTENSPWIGWTIRVSGYGTAEAMDSPTSIVPVDQPLWLVYMTAAEFARNDYIKSGQYGNIVALAANVMGSMKQNNEAAQHIIADHGNFEPLGETITFS